MEAKGLSSRRQALANTVQLLELQAQGMQGILASGGDPARLPPLPTVPTVADPDQASKLLIANQQALQMRSQLVQLANKLASTRQTLAQEAADDPSPCLMPAACHAMPTLSSSTDSGDQSQRGQSGGGAFWVMGQVASQLNQTNRQPLGLR